MGKATRNYSPMAIARSGNSETKEYENATLAPASYPESHMKSYVSTNLTTCSFYSGLETSTYLLTSQLYYYLF